MPCSYFKIVLTLNFLSLILCHSPIACQEVVFNYDVKLNRPISFDLAVYSNNKEIEVLPIAENGKGLDLIFLSKSEVSRLNLNSDFQITGSTSIPRPERPFVNLNGYSIGIEGNLYLYFSNVSFKKWGCLILRPDGSQQFLELDYSPAKGRVLGIFQRNHTLNVMVLEKNSSNIHLTTLEGKSKTKRVYDLNKERFVDFKGDKLPLAKIIGTYSVQLVDPVLPFSLIDASARRKIYITPERIILGLNHQKGATRVVELDFNSESYKVKTFPIPLYLFNGTGNISANSFIADNKVFQIAGSSWHFYLGISDIKTGEVLKTFEFSDEQNIDFANSPIYMEGNIYSSGIKELERSKQFLRSLSNTEASITARVEGDRMVLKLGSVIVGGSYSIPMDVGTPSGTPFTSGLAPATIFSNYSFGDREVYFKTILNRKSLEHQLGNPKANLFERIEESVPESREQDLNTLFKLGDKFYYGYYEKDQKSYRLLEFKP